jgi:hypothetical protein
MKSKNLRILISVIYFSISNTKITSAIYNFKCHVYILQIVLLTVSNGSVTKYDDR